MLFGSQYMESTEKKGINAEVDFATKCDFLIDSW